MPLIFELRVIRMSINIPSLESLARAVVIKNVTEESLRYYRGRTVCSLGTNTFSTPSFIRRILSYMTEGQGLSPEERLITIVPSSILLKDTNLEPRLLAAIERAEPELYHDSRWQRLFEARWVNSPSYSRPQFSSYRGAYILHSLLASIQSANHDIKKVPAHELAFFTQNAHLCDSFEILTYIYSFNPQTLFSIMSYTAQVKSISIRNFSHLTQEMICAFIKKNPQLEIIHLRGGSLLCAKSLNAMAKYCRSLKDLHVFTMSSDATLGHLLKVLANNQHIHTLTLGPVEGLNDLTFKEMIPLLPRIKKLTIAFSKDLSPAILEDLFAGDRRLEDLTIDSCEKFCDANIDQEEKSYPLTRLKVIEGPLTAQGMARLRNKFKLP